MIDQDEAGVILGILKALDPGNFVNVDETTLLVWADALNAAPAIPFDTARKAALRLAATGERFPRPKEFREFVAEQTDGLPSAAEAKAQIERSIRERPSVISQSTKLSYTPHPLVLQASRQIGGTYRLRVAQSERETAQWWREFDQAYATLRRQHAAPALPEPAAHALTDGSRR